MDVQNNEKFTLDTKQEFDAVFEEAKSLFEDGGDCIYFFSEESPKEYPCVCVFIPDCNDMGWYANMVFVYKSDF